MQFSTGVVTFFVAATYQALVVSAFNVPSTPFVNSRGTDSSSVTTLNLIPISSGELTSEWGRVRRSNCDCKCAKCLDASSKGRLCDCCTNTSLRMSTEIEADGEVPDVKTEEVPDVEVTAEATVEVPAEVAAMDGIASSEEAHNTDRPARDSGLKKHKKASRGTPLSELEIGSTVDGKVKTITSYGAFVDIGAASDALLHVSRLSADFVSNVEDVVKAGQEVQVRIASVDTEKNQIALTMLTEAEEEAAKGQRGGGSGGKRKERPQRSQGDRRTQIATMNAVNEKGLDTNKFIEGEVVSTLDFGAFVRFDASQLAEGVTGELDGLVHISALQTGRVDSVGSVVSVGGKVQIRVKLIDAEGGKVSLSMITDEQEQENRPKRGGGGGGRGGKSMFSDSDMGAKDWKESLEKFQSDTEASFSNAPVVQQKRK